jgi:thermitase
MVMGIIHLVAPQAQLLPLKAFSSDGTGYLSNILHAVYYGVQGGTNVINMSFDTKSNSKEFSKAITYANQNSVICAASAGNDGMQEIVYPAAYQNDVMGVASTSDTDTRSSFSNYGDAVVWVAAPGEAIISTYPFSTYAAGWGTSFSAPFVSGAGALLLNLDPTTNESKAAAALAYAVPLGAGMGNGRLDLVEALQSVSPAARNTANFSLSVGSSGNTISLGQSAADTVSGTPSGGVQSRGGV